MIDQPWIMTGELTLSRGLFGRLIITLEETRAIYRPLVTGYTPANWRTERRHRAARFADLAKIHNAIIKPHPSHG